MNPLCQKANSSIRLNTDGPWVATSDRGSTGYTVDTLQNRVSNCLLSFMGCKVIAYFI